MCQVCEKTEFKYKCPKCYIKYCSVECYKVHNCVVKENSRPKPKVFAKKQHNNAGEEEDSELLTQDQLKHLDCLEMKKLLQNPHLRNILRQIDSNRDPELALEQHYDEPLVKEFVECAMLKPYVSKRRKTSHGPSPGKGENTEILPLIWRQPPSQTRSLQLPGFASEIVWSDERLFVALLTGEIGVINKNEEEDLTLTTFHKVSTIPRGLTVSGTLCQFVSLHGIYHNINLSSSTATSHLSVSTVNAVVAWQGHLILGCKLLHLTYQGLLLRSFGNPSHSVSAMVVVGDTLFVAYDYNQSSSSHNSIVGYSLPGGAPLAAGLTTSIPSYTSLRYDPPWVYGLTLYGQVTRFSTDPPHRPDKSFREQIPLSPGYQHQFGVGGGRLVCGDDRGGLVVISLEGRRKRRVVEVADSPLVNVTLRDSSWVVACSWDRRLFMLDIDKQTNIL